MTLNTAEASNTACRTNMDAGPGRGHPPTRKRRPGTPAWTLAALLLAATALPSAAQPAVDSAWILQRLARPAPVRTPFVELRGSAMLKAPLRIEGEYARPDATTLVREVRVPYAETTTIRGGEATIARGDRRPRTFALSRAPELAGLQASFGALLAGDAAALQRDYRISADGSREDWTLVLVPRDAALAASVRDITLHGRGAELRCIETRPAEGELQRSLLAGAARAAIAAGDGAAYEVLCRDPAAAAQ
ncbi:LolA-related protein [Luteimonas sp. MJ145]|uniref:LolA-related protein n=1 Tax=Luteimonas sp. MJ145 TaxID=3129234 RepID=UPI0031BB6AE8